MSSLKISVALPWKTYQRLNSQSQGSCHTIRAWCSLPSQVEFSVVFSWFWAQRKEALKTFLECLSVSLPEIWSFLEKRRLWGDMEVCKCFMGRNEEGARLHSVVYINGTRGSDHKIKHIKFNLNIRKLLLWGCLSTGTGFLKKLLFPSVEVLNKTQLGLWPTSILIQMTALEPGVGLSNLRRSLPTSVSEILRCIGLIVWTMLGTQMIYASITIFHDTFVNLKYLYWPTWMQTHSPLRNNLCYF